MFEYDGLTPTGIEETENGFRLVAKGEATYVDIAVTPDGDEFMCEGQLFQDGVKRQTTSRRLDAEAATEFMRVARGKAAQTLNMVQAHTHEAVFEELPNGFKFWLHHGAERDDDPATVTVYEKDGRWCLDQDARDQAMVRRFDSEDEARKGLKGLREEAEKMGGTRCGPHALPEGSGRKARVEVMEIDQLPEEFRRMLGL